MMLINYCVGNRTYCNRKENIGVYVEVGLEGNGIFEHMIPVATIVDLLIKKKDYNTPSM